MKILSMYYMKFIRLVKKYNLVIFILLVFAALVIIILSVVEIINQSVVIEPQNTNTGVNVNIDLSTIDKIQSLNNSSVAPTINLPSGRINPFGE